MSVSAFTSLPLALCVELLVVALGNITRVSQVICVVKSVQVIVVFGIVVIGSVANP